jgi:hypothetical protein
VTTGRTDQYEAGITSGVPSAAAPSIARRRKRSACAPRRTARAASTAAVRRTPASSVASALHPGSAQAAAISAGADAAIPSSRIRRSSTEVKSADPAHSRHASAGTHAAWTYASRTRRSQVIQRLPTAGSITCTQRPWRRHATTKWVKPLGSRTTTMAGSARASGSRKLSAGTMICSAGRPSCPATTSSESMEVPSTSVWQASRRRP